MTDTLDDATLVAALKHLKIERDAMTLLRADLAAMTTERDQCRADHKRANEALAEIEDENVRLTAERDKMTGLLTAWLYSGAMTGEQRAALIADTEKAVAG